MGTAWYPSSNRSVCRSPATGWYHQLKLFSPCYCSKSAGNDRFRLVAAHCQAISVEGEGRRGRTWTLDVALPRRSRFVAHGEKKPRRGFMWRISFGDHGEKQRGREALKKKCELREACGLLADTSRGAQKHGQSHFGQGSLFRSIPPSTGNMYRSDRVTVYMDHPALGRGGASFTRLKTTCRLVFLQWDEALPSSSFFSWKARQGGGDASSSCTVTRRCLVLPLEDKASPHLPSLG
ncbi:hypothetical protein B296_00038024 [Ensete ventricosum]|uniref:Uncharacterized protein n=1 Tax=Ensete ventricosum TaxID=4639 RepID=A0A426ZC43_ENSVE|nr:hypothetical protein B296_00038024 [Ensete ventricosum]